MEFGLSINAIRYDGRGRRIVKAVRNSADLDATYHYYYDGDSMIEGAEKGSSLFFSGRG